MSNSTTVLLPAYRRTLLEKYHGKNVHLRAHGIFSAEPQFPDFSLRNNPGPRILAFGKWGTYKKVDRLVEAYDEIARRVPNCKLIIAGENHPAAPGYVESIAERCKGRNDVEIIGYVPEDHIPELFRSASALVMPYTSIVCADIDDFREMAVEEGIAIEFYRPGDARALADAIVSLLNNEERQREMSEQNFYSAMRLTMPQIVYQYLRALEWERRARGMRQRVRQLRWSLVTRNPAGFDLDGHGALGGPVTNASAIAPSTAARSFALDEPLAIANGGPSALSAREPVHPKYTIVVPTEGNDLEAVLRSFQKVAAQNRWNAELLVLGENAQLPTAKDSSQDNSSPRLPVRVVDAGLENLTIRDAFRSGSGDVFVFLKSRGVQGRELKKMIGAVEQGADVAIGLPSGSDPGALRRGVNWMAHRALKVDMPLESPAIACTRRAAEAIFSVHRTMNGAGEMEMVYLARKFGLSVKPVPLPWSANGLSSVSGPLKHALQIRWNELKGSYQATSLAYMRKVRRESEKAA
jgi:Glycosyl transferases group 1